MEVEQLFTGVVAMVLGVGMLGAGLGLGGAYPVAEAHEAWTVEHAETVPGIVLGTETRQVECGNLWESRTCTAVEVRYRYTVNGETYNSTGTAFRGVDGPRDRRFGSAEAAASHRSTYAPHSGVTVHYLPGDPTTSFLDPPEVEWELVVVGLVLGALFVACSVFVLLAGVRALRGKSVG